MTMPDDSSAIRKMLSIIADLEQTASTAKRSLFSGGSMVTIDRSVLEAKLRQLSAAVPTAVTAAKTVIDSEESILSEAKAEHDRLINEANQYASDTTSKAESEAARLAEESQKKAAETTQEAQARAQGILAGAQTDYRRIIDEAQQQAQFLVSQEEVLRRATVAADELRQRTEAEMADLRTKTFDYLDSVMDQLDRRFTDTVTDLRAERSELNARRG